MANLSMNDVADSWKKFAKMSVTTFSRAKQASNRSSWYSLRSEYHFNSVVFSLISSPRKS